MFLSLYEINISLYRTNVKKKVINTSLFKAKFYKIAEPIALRSKWLVFVLPKDKMDVADILCYVYKKSRCFLLDSAVSEINENMKDSSSFRKRSEIWIRLKWWLLI